MPSLLSMIQLFVLWLFTFPMYPHYFKNNKKKSNEQERQKYFDFQRFIWCLYFIDYKTTPLRERRMARILFGLSILFFIVMSGIAAALIIFTGECSYP